MSAYSVPTPWLGARSIKMNIIILLLGSFLVFIV